MDFVKKNGAEVVAFGAACFAGQNAQHASCLRVFDDVSKRMQFPAKDRVKFNHARALAENNASLGAVSSNDRNFGTDFCEQRVERNASRQQALTIFAWHEQQPAAMFALPFLRVGEKVPQDFALPRAERDQSTGFVSA